MTVRNKDDWFMLAAQTIPKLPEYAGEFGLEFPYKDAMKALVNLDHEYLHCLFEKLWSDLPDNPSIQFYPFGDLCDLCSEYWVFDPEQQE